ncbi:transposable element Tc1 transposase [Trichonephila clavipes]|nr:transposable element Tc1 transposase [Trichonephila clavipes]
MVWAGIMINGRTRLHVFANGTMTGQRYIDEVLLPHVRLFRGAVGDKFVFMDDNATYLNPIENVWDALGRQVARRNYPPTNKNTLIRALTEEWDKLPQQLLDNVVQSMLLQAEIRRGIDSIRITYEPPVEDPAIVFASAQLILLYLGTAAVAFPARQTCSIGERSGQDLAGHGSTSYP